MYLEVLQLLGTKGCCRCSDSHSSTRGSGLMWSVGGAPPITLFRSYWKYRGGEVPDVDVSGSCDLK